MKIFKVSRNLDRKIINYAANVLESGGIAILPTDTLYALSASALDKKCIKKIYKIKGRKFDKPLSIMFYSLSQARKYVKFNKLALKIARKFLPGPLTLVLTMKCKFPKELTFGSKKVGIRIPDNKITLEILKKVKIPIIATSANISGKKNSIDVKTALSQIGNRVDVILDQGRCKYNKPSTVVELAKDDVKIVREGVISKKELESVL